jgi:hypothetical protein
VFHVRYEMGFYIPEDGILLNANFVDIVRINW